MRDEGKIREIVREEVRAVLKRAGIPLNEGTPKKGSRVRTPHGSGTVLSVSGEQVRVRLDAGAVIKTHRDRAVVVG